MKKLLLPAACAAAALSLCACGPTGLALGAPGGTAAANSALHDFLTDPACSHHDEASFITGAGGLPASFQAKVMRDCPAKQGTQPLATGAVIATQ
jgi:hypothetical protein